MFLEARRAVGPTIDARGAVLAGDICVPAALDPLGILNPGRPRVGVTSPRRCTFEPVRRRFPSTALPTEATFDVAGRRRRSHPRGGQAGADWRDGGRMRCPGRADPQTGGQR